MRLSELASALVFEVIVTEVAETAMVVDPVFARVAAAMTDRPGAR
jgi:hypothetical protein